MDFTDHYKMLGIPQSASSAEIKTAYRKLSKKFHPDANDGDKYFEERFKEIHAAYEILNDKNYREAYDRSYEFQKSGYGSQTTSNTSQNSTQTNNAEQNKNESKNKEQQQDKRADSPEWQAVFEKTKQRSSHGGYNKENTNNYTSPNRTNNGKIEFGIAARLIVFIIFICLILILSNYTSKKYDYTTIPVVSTVAAATDTSNKKIANLNDIVVMADSVTSIKVDSFRGALLRIKGQLIPLREFRGYLDTLLKDDLDTLDRLFIDLDFDGKPEIITRYWSGGVHCCDINQIWTLDSSNVYINVFTFSGGMKINGNELECNLYETMGYFMSCYDCSIENRMADKYYSPVVHFRYRRGNLTPFISQNITNEIITDLEELSQHPVPEIKDRFDDGTRKAYASRIITYNLGTTNFKSGKTLFDIYYKGADKDSVWNQISEYMNFILTKDIKFGDD